MEQQRFDEFFHLLTNDAIEGGFSNRKEDAGGKTKYGITEKTYKHALDTLCIPNVPLEKMSLDTAKMIYRIFYYDPCIGVEDKESHYNLFDAHVNGGYGAYRELKKVIDGISDPLIMREAIYQAREHRFRLLAEHDHVHGQPNLHGWLLRLERIKQYFHTGKITT